MEINGHFNSLLPHHVYVYIIYTCMYFLCNWSGCMHGFRDAVRYSFGAVIQKELDQFVHDWNSHRIRHTNMAEVPHGIPDVLYTVPSLKGIIICKIVV